MNYVPNGTMTLWWVSNALLTGIDLGAKWPNIGFLSAGPFTANGGRGINDFLVSNLADGHIYDWWISTQNQLTGLDLTAGSGVVEQRQRGRDQPIHRQRLHQSSGEQ